MVLSLCMLGLFCAAPIAFIDSFPIFVVLLWMLLFFGGAVLPAMTGIMLNTIEGHMKTTANSFANLAYNLIGYLPAPGVYGYIYDSGDGGNSREAMATLMFTPIISVICVYISACIIIKKDLFYYELLKDAERESRGSVTKIEKKQENDKENKVDQENNYDQTELVNAIKDYDVKNGENNVEEMKKLNEA